MKRVEIKFKNGNKTIRGIYTLKENSNEDKLLQSFGNELKKGWEISEVKEIEPKEI